MDLKNSLVWLYSVKIFSLALFLTFVYNLNSPENLYNSMSQCRGLGAEDISIIEVFKSFSSRGEFSELHPRGQAIVRRTYVL